MPLITSRTDWTIPLIEKVWDHIEDVAVNDLGLTYYQPQIEIVSAEQMLDAYSSIGYPVNYNHWSFGKDFLVNQENYRKGMMNLAYEMIIQTNPAITYLMSENDAVMQALVLAHACVGHNFVYKNNYLFNESGISESIIDYMVYARDYIKSCEEKYGEREVETLLDHAHTIARNSIDKYERKYKKSLNEDQQQIANAKKAEEEQKNLDIVIKTTTELEEKASEDETEKDIDDENLLYYIATHSVKLEPWQREILTIVRRINQSLYPQMQTKLLHEGFATFTHVYIMNELEKRGVISPDAQISWVHSHSNVTYQSDMHSKHYDGNFNPYSLGSSIFNDIRRICESPTKEDELWFPDLIGKPWREEVRKAASSYNDESFVAQFLSPTIMRKYKMMLVDPLTDDSVIVSEISDDNGYKAIRRNLSDSYNIVNRIPDIVVKKADMKNDRKLILEYRPYHDRKLERTYEIETLRAVESLWGYPVNLVTKED